jgi:hypothetical protein
MLKKKELIVFYPWKFFPYVAETQVLIEYSITEEGADIENIFVSGDVPSRSIDYVKREAREQFYNLHERTC